MNVNKKEQGQERGKNEMKKKEITHDVSPMVDNGLKECWCFGVCLHTTPI